MAAEVDRRQPGQVRWAPSERRGGFPVSEASARQPQHLRREHTRELLIVGRYDPYSGLPADTYSVPLSPERSAAELATSKAILAALATRPDRSSRLLSDSAVVQIGWGFPALLAAILATGFAVRAFARRRGGKGGEALRGRTLVALYAVMYLALAGPSVALAALLALLILAASREWLQARPTFPMSPLGLVAIVVGFLALLLVRKEPDGARLAVLLFFLVNASDSAALLGGSLFGRTKLAPRISPSKTVEGGLSGIAFSMVIAPLLARAVGLELPVGSLVVAGGLISLAGQGGDLLWSAAKRRLEIKDFGTLLPGHGGVLDRFDSTLLASPVFLVLIHVGLFS